MRLRATFLWIMIGSLSLAAAIGVMAILLPGFGSTQESILFSALFVGAFSITALAAAVVLGKGRLVPVMWVGIASSGLALLIWLAVVWLEPWRWRGSTDWEELFLKPGATFTIVAVWAAHLGLLALPRLDRTQGRITRRATVVLAGLLAGGLVLVFCFEVFEDWSGRLIGVLSILTACGTAVTPTLALIEFVARRSSSETLPSKVTVNLTCPRCRATQELRAGPGKCQACGLRIELEVEEPRCSCGYLLYQLKADRCPECGRQIPPDDRWGPAEAA